MRDRFVSQQVRILLERMDTHPEEFSRHLSLTTRAFGGKWDLVLTSGEFTLLEKYLIRRKIKQIKRAITHQQILMTIMYGQDEHDSDGPLMSTTSRFNQGVVVNKAILKVVQEPKN